jgi:hypothetical protein
MHSITTGCQRRPLFLGEKQIFSTKKSQLNQEEY